MNTLRRDLADERIREIATSGDHVMCCYSLLPAHDTGLVADSKAQAEQVRSIAFERIGPQVGTISAALQAALDEALKLHLAL